MNSLYLYRLHILDPFFYLVEIATEPGIPCLPVPPLGRWLVTAFDFVSVHFDVTRLIRTAQMLRKERERGACLVITDSRVALCRCLCRLTPSAGGLTNLDSTLLSLNYMTAQTGMIPFVWRLCNSLPPRRDFPV